MCMQPIKALLKYGERNDAIANLNNALLFLADKTPVQATAVPGIKTVGEIRNTISKNLTLFDDNTKQLLMHVQANAGLPPTGELDENAVTKINELLQQHGAFTTPGGISPVMISGDEQQELTIEGYVTNALQLPIANVIVKAFDKDLRSEESIGETATNENGYYLISYKADMFAKQENKSADLLMHVYNNANKKLYESDNVIFNIPEKFIYNIRLENYTVEQESEFEIIKNTITPVLDGLTIVELKEDDEYKDVSFLSNECEIPYERIEYFVLAHKLNATYQIPPEFFYALFRQDAIEKDSVTGVVKLRINISLDADLTILFYEIVLLPADSIVKEINNAVQANIISASISSQMDAISNQLAQSQQQALNYFESERPQQTATAFTSISLQPLNDAMPLAEKDFVDAKLNSILKEKIQSVFAGSADNIKKAIAAMTINYRDVADLGFTDYVNKNILPRLNKFDVNAAQSFNANNGSSNIKSMLNLDLPLKRNPLFGNEIRDLKINAYTNIAGIGSTKVAAIAALNLDPSYFSVNHYEKLVNDNVLTPDEANNLHLIFEYSKLTDDNLPLIQALKSTSLTSVKALVKWQQQDWLNFLKEKSISAPNGETPEVYADNMMANLERSFPSASFLNTTLLKTQSSLADIDTILTIPPLYVEDGNPNNPDHEAIKAAEAKRLNFSNSYKYWGIPEILEDENTTVEIKKQQITSKVQQYGNFLNNNPDIDLLTTNMFDEKATGQFNWEGIDEDNKTGLLKQLKANQRLLFLSDTISNAHALMEGGFDSAYNIISLSYPDFQAASGLEDAAARSVYVKSKNVGTKAVHAAQIARDINADARFTGMWNNLAFSGVTDQFDIDPKTDPGKINPFPKIDGYSDFFGSQDYCDCDHCCSIFSPAAYFVDLMEFIRKNVSDKVFTSSLEPSALYLKNRRPDLWTLPLTCENTDTLIPYLDVVNDVLEQYIESIKKRVDAPDVYLFLTTQNISFNLPFNENLEELRIYLGHFSITLFQVFSLLRKNNDDFYTDKDVWRERLSISNEEFGIITNEDTGNIKNRIGNPDPTLFGRLPVQDFIQYAGISRDDLTNILQISFYGLGSINIKPEPGTDPETDPLINYVEYIYGLTNANLDFIHRFIRLWRKTGWSFSEFDLILSSLKNCGLLLTTDAATSNNINEPAVILSCKLIELQQRLRLTTEEIPCLYGSLPDMIVDGNALSFYVRTFGTQLLKDSISFNATAKIVDPNLGSLLGGLAVSEGELLQLLKLLSKEITPDAEGNPVLTPEIISKLYYHARLAKALSFFIEEFILVINLLFAGEPSNSIENTFALIEFKNKLVSTALKVSDLWFIIKGEEKSLAAYKTTTAQVNSMIVNLQSTNAIYFNPAFLADITDIGLDLSGKIIAKMVEDGMAEKKSETEIIFKLTGKYSFDKIITDAYFNTILTSIGAPAETFATIPDIQAKFASFINENLGKLLNLTPTLTEKLLSFIVTPADMMSLYQTMFAEFSDVSIIVSVVKLFDRVQYLFARLNFTNADILFFADNHNVFGISDMLHFIFSDTGTTELFNAVFNSIINMSAYKKLVTANIDKTNDLNALLTDFQNKKPFNDAEFDLLAATWKTEKNLIQSIASSTGIVLPKTATEAISYISECLSLCKTIGINGSGLSQLITTDFNELGKARDLIIGTFASKYPDEQDRQTKLEPYHDKVNTIKRDALCDFIIADIKELAFRGRSDLYAYFLLDVEMSGCFRTSKIVAAISSLQLYVYRVIMNLEQSVKDKIDVLQILTSKDKDAYTEFKNEWEEWRQNYRVWEANRKVFLYPENYIFPELRDDKTPLFEELEDELLQEKITKESAEAAYLKYVAQFSELANLIIAGSYYYEGDGDDDPQKNTYYFFGRTKDPYQYYYRKWENQTTWTAWEKIELAINCPYITAIVYFGKLFIFWMEINVKERTTLKEGTSSSDFFLHGTSLSDGFLHTIELSYSSVQENNQWTPRQKLVFTDPLLYSYDYKNKIRNKCFPFIDNEGNLYLFYSTFDKWSVKKINPLTGNIEQAGTTIDTSKLVFYAKRINLFTNTMIDDSGHQDVLSANSDLIYIPPHSLLCLKTYKSTYVMSESQLDYVSEPLDVDPDPSPYSSALLITDTVENDISSNMQTTLMVVGRKDDDFILKIANQEYLINKRPSVEGLSIAEVAALVGKYPGRWYLTPIGTTLTAKLGERLFTRGLDEFLSVDTQKFQEDAFPLRITQPSFLFNPVLTDHINFDNSFAYGIYYQELFFHIPFLIANHLNADQKFEEADWWYRKIFDPTSSDVAVEKDGNWQYIDFRGVPVEKLQDILTDDAAIKKYEGDPFNPFAIARVRKNAFQKTIVMKHIDNLIDWGDYLFGQDTMESITEATMLYVMASQILGKRPAKLGKCDTANGNTLMYENMAPESEFLVYLENYVYNLKAVRASRNLAATASIAVSASGASSGLNVAGDGIGGKFDYVETYHSAKTKKGSSNIYSGKESTRPPLFDLKKLAFCIPNNEDFFAYWDRVEDRLFKIRNCMNISGVYRQLALFQPPIDPMMLIRAKAAGLSLEDILGSISKPPSPYRFIYLIEKAKQFTQTVQSFGGTLLSALEKKDVEELTLLRSLHEKEILNLTTDIKNKAILQAQNQQLALIDQQTNIQNRIDYYTGLLDEGLINWENTQVITKHVATGFEIAGSSLRLIASILGLAPDTGSPFAMKYGGTEISRSAAILSEWLHDLAAISNSISSSAGLVATYQRREQEWKQQLLIATQEYTQISKQILAAQFWEEIAEKDLEIHQKNIDHHHEIDDFYAGKFTNLGLYNYLATTLTGLFREAYGMAYEMASMAEQAYQAERDDEAIFIAPDNWQLDKAGLLAGEKLMLQLQRMEMAYIENNKRDYEITQAFSMALINPEALLKLKQNGNCDFDIPEIVYDLFYPGQYNRKIKSIRITIPCIAGPYTNISCKLSLTDNQIRKIPKDGSDTELFKKIPLQSSIATSNAQNDSGMFELNFHDERYLPFEGAGAISSWHLELPKIIRSVNYDSISDVIFHVSFTAKDDDVYRGKVEDNILSTITAFASSTGLFRMFSLKYDFPNEFYQLMNSSVTTTQSTIIALTSNHFPYMFADKALSLSIKGNSIFLKPVKGKITTGELTIELISLEKRIVPSTLSPGSNEFLINSWEAFPKDTISNQLEQGLIEITSSTVNPINDWQINGKGLTKEEIDDVLILLQYKI